MKQASGLDWDVTGYSSYWSDMKTCAAYLGSDGLIRYTLITQYRSLTAVDVYDYAEVVQQVPAQNFVLFRPKRFQLVVRNGKTQIKTAQPTFYRSLVSLITTGGYTVPTLLDLTMRENGDVPFIEHMAFNGAMTTQNRGEKMKEDEKKAALIAGGALLLGAAAYSRLGKSKTSEPVPGSLGGQETVEPVTDTPAESGGLAGSSVRTETNTEALYDVWVGIGWDTRWTTPETAERLRLALKLAPEGSYIAATQSGFVIIRPTTEAEEEAEQQYIDEYLQQKEEQQQEAEQTAYEQQQAPKTKLKYDRWVFNGPKKLEPEECRYAFLQISGIEISTYKGTPVASGNTDGSWNFHVYNATENTPASQWVVIAYRFDMNDTGLPLGKRSKEYFPFAYKGGRA